jgi:hypothetical protein
MHTVTILLDQEPRTPHHATFARNLTSRGAADRQRSESRHEQEAPKAIVPSDFPPQALHSQGSFLIILSIFL